MVTGAQIEVEALKIEKPDAKPQFNSVLPFRFVQALVENDRSWQNATPTDEVQKLALYYADLSLPVLPTLGFAIKGEPIFNEASPGDSALITLKFDPGAETILLSERKVWDALEIAKLEHGTPIGIIPISLAFVNDLQNVEKFTYQLPDFFQSKGNYTSFAEKKSLANAALSHFTKFTGLIEMNRASLAPRSRNLFTLTAIANAASHFIADVATGNLDEDAKLVAEFLESLSNVFPVWNEVAKGEEKSAVAREQFIHSNAGGITAIAIVANTWLKQGDSWKSKIENFKKIDWLKSNGDLWEGSILVNGAITKKREGIELAANRILDFLSN